MQNRISGRDGPLQNGTDSANLAALVTRLRSDDTDMLETAYFINAEAPTLGNTATLWTTTQLDSQGGIRLTTDPATEQTRSRFPWLMFVMTSDQNSATGGVVMEADLSGGGTFQTVGAAQSYLTADGLTAYVFRRLSDNMRLKYTGGGTTPTTFFGRLYMMRTNPGI
jgi:hypothetical protein